MKLRFIGCGDAFGSGGRFNTCFHLSGERTSVLIDCGASSLIAMKQQGVDHNRIEAVFFTHYHADHFGGVPFLILDAQFFSRRTTPLTLVGPAGLREAYERAMETAFPGSTATRQRFELRFVELTPGRSAEVAGVTVHPVQAHHGTPGGPFLALRLEAEGRSVAYTGDTEWVEEIVDVARDADLFIAEAYFRDKSVPYHLDLATLERALDRIAPRRLILTHMSDDMLGRCSELDFETAADGLVVSL